MQIQVINKTMWPEPVTVTIKEDGLIYACNHAGAEEEELESGQYYSGQPDMVQITYELVCDKCGASKPNWSDSWFEEPAGGTF